MCGIVGRFSKSNRPYEAIDQRLLNHVDHRGPDGQGSFEEAGVFLGHRRLAIIDIEGGSQPIYSEDGRYVIVCNGEIFNYRKLKSEMKGSGETFRTDSDIEVLLKGYQKYGSIFFDRLEGMYAGIIYDKKTNKGLCFRDPFGIKPLYYAQTSGHIFLSSEVNALAALEEVSKEIEMESVSQLFQIGYVIGEQSVYKQIKRLLPGHFLHISSNQKIELEPFTHLMNPNMLGDLIQEESENPLIEAFSRACEADVSVDLYLSGGIDSGLIASILRKELDRRPKAYSIAYDIDTQRNEADSAESIARELDLEHQKIMFSHRHVMDIDEYAAKIDTPAMDPSAMALFELSKEASKHSKVVLSGEGGDEIFGGYQRYRRFPMMQKVSSLPKHLESFLLYLGQKMASGEMKNKIHKWESIRNMPISSRYAALFSFFDLKILSGFPSLNQKELQAFFHRLFHVSSSLPVSLRLRWIDMVTFLSDCLLPKADQTAMSHGLEVRLPFLQSDVLLYGFSMGQNQSFRTADQKPVLKKMLETYLPKHLIANKKIGFELPISEWFRGDLNKWVHGKLSRGPLIQSDFLPTGLVERLLGEHEQKKADHSRGIYQILILNAWLGVRNLSLEGEKFQAPKAVKSSSNISQSLSLPSI